ncbi:sugar phosphate isomerase/epimerase family protein [Haloarcula sediminis]|uniref:sugar phosphate isomerase/epimerase family protein n=1 Tax=Haloarcula sediminis TaxID=3111777 RepID=UPI002D7788A2|nr:sugar phosphate isomerase/epimerase [Haloarcula sp. CK38]
MVRPALQLYSVRAAETPRPALLSRIREAGYEGVEFASPPTADADELFTELADAGLEAVGIHVRLADLAHRLPAVIETCRALGCDAVAIAHVSPSHFRTPVRVRRLAQYVNERAARLSEAGVSLHYHNQCFEFQRVETPAPLDIASGVFNPTPLPPPGDQRDAGPLATGRRMAGTAAEHLLDRVTSPPTADAFAETGLAYFLDRTDAVHVEPDVGNVRVAGFDPTAVLDATADRSTLVHVKDEFVASPGPDPEERPAPIGAGDVDVAAAIQAAAATEAEWVVLENDDPPEPSVPIENGIDAFESHALRYQTPVEVG